MHTKAITRSHLTRSHSHAPMNTEVITRSVAQTRHWSTTSEHCLWRERKGQEVRRGRSIRHRDAGRSNSWTWLSWRLKLKLTTPSKDERSSKALELCKHESTTSAVGPLETVSLCIGAKFGEGALFLAAWKAVRKGCPEVFTDCRRCVWLVWVCRSGKFVYHRACACLMVSIWKREPAESQLRHLSRTAKPPNAFPEAGLLTVNSTPTIVKHNTQVVFCL